MKKLMGLVTANYSNEAFGVLTNERPVASLPFGGRYRLIDFPLSNMMNSGITTVGLITPYMYRSLMDHVGVGKEWSLNRKIGGMFILPGSIYGLKSTRGKFLLRDIIQNTPFLIRGGCDLVAVTGCNRIYNIDFREVAAQHESGGAEITLVYQKRDDGGEGQYLTFSENGRVTAVKNDAGSGNYFLDAFIINRELLLKFTNWYQALGYLDLMEIIGENLDKVRVRGFEYAGYVGCVDGLDSYMQTNLALLRADVRDALFLRDRPICTKVQDSPPAKYLETSHVCNSLISSGCTIEGTVENSIIFRGVRVGRGAVVRSCVIMQGCEIGEDTNLENIICDKYVEVKAGVKVTASPDAPIAVGKKQEL